MRILFLEEEKRDNAVFDMQYGNIPGNVNADAYFPIEFFKRTIKKSFYPMRKEDFSTKYIELIKTIPSPHSHEISLLVAGILIKLFFPYAPLMTTDLWQKMGFKGQITEPFPTNFFP